LRTTEFRLAKRGNEYLTQWRYVNTTVKPTSKWWKFWKAEYETVNSYGEWNDTLHNDIMHLKRTVVDHFVDAGIKHFILVGENVLNFHGSFEDDYYAEWFEDVEDGWIAAMHFAPFVEQEWAKYKIDYYLNFGGNLQIPNWRTLKPEMIFFMVDKLLKRRLNP
jgi:hypothetical protein